jgi:hypothetical protein
MKFFTNEQDGNLQVTAVIELAKIYNTLTEECLADILKKITEKATEEIYAKYKKEIFSKIDTKTVIATVTKNILKKLSE